MTERVQQGLYDRLIYSVKHQFAYSVFEESDTLGLFQLPLSTWSLFIMGLSYVNYNGHSVILDMISLNILSKRSVIAKIS